MKSFKVVTLSAAGAMIIAASIYVLSTRENRYIASYSDERLELLKSELVFDLRCSEKPDPLKYLMALDEWNYLDKRKRYRVDGIGCFPFAKEFVIEDQKFLMICGYDNSQLWQELNSTYFQRLPVGTNPPDYLSLVTQSNTVEINIWEKEKLKFGYPADPPSLTVEKSWMIDSIDIKMPESIQLYEIVCSRYQ